MSNIINNAVKVYTYIDDLLNKSIHTNGTDKRHNVELSRPLERVGSGSA